MNNTWIKLYRKVIENEVFHDESAFRVFMWILCSCDYKTGKMISGRFWASEILRMKPITYYRVLKRLEKKHDLVTLSSNNKNTIISVNKWHLYQQDSNNKVNNKVTTNEQQSNTNQEVKNIRIKKNTYSSIGSLKEKEFEKIAKDYGVPISLVRSSCDDLKNYCSSKGKKYTNYLSALRSFTKRNAMKTIKEGNATTKRTIDARGVK